MCFLACLTAGAVYMINESANAWLKDIASEVTVQVEPRDGIDIEKTVRDAEAFLRSSKGVSRANALSLEESSKLLEPWLGQSDVLAALPVPRLIAIEIDRSEPPNIEALRAELTKRFPSASLDDHRRWQQQIRTVTRSFALGGLGILLLVCAATTAVIVSATRSALVAYSSFNIIVMRSSGVWLSCILLARLTQARPRSLKTFASAAPPLSP